MTWDDEKFNVRQGPAIGKSSELRMLAAMGGAGTIKKRFQTNNDGSVTMAHTRGPWAQPEFITNEPLGGINALCSLDMDSGIADMIGISEFGPGLYSPAKIYQTEYVAGHVGTAETAIGSGKLRYPSFIGNVVADGADAKAFSNTFDGGTSYMDRKKLAAHIPASLFTGRTRLYVQSLFGGNWPALVLADASNGAGRPILSVNTKARVDAGLQPALIGSGCGIYFDADNKSHFLIQPGETSANVIPLIGTACAERYRRLLQSDTTLSEDDQERIESYILSQSFPDPDFTTILNYESTPSEGLGYSWHWNWDGNKCDIVNVDEVYIADPGVYGFETTHYRLSFTNIGPNLSVERSIVAGPDTWTVPKNTNVIAYPDWVARVLLKAGNLPSGRTDIAQSGDVYCFYVKNELKVLRLSSGAVTATKTRVSDPPYYGGSSYDNPAMYILETENGKSVATSTQSGYSVQFTCGSTTVGGASRNETTYTDEKVWIGRDAPTYLDSPNTSQPAGTTEAHDDGLPTVDIAYTAYGAPTPPIVTTYNQVLNTCPSETPPAGYYMGVTRYLTIGRWDASNEARSSTVGFKTLVIIPFNDAEAAYLSDQKVSVDDVTSYTGQRDFIQTVGQSQPYYINALGVPVNTKLVTKYWFATTSGYGAVQIASDVNGTYTPSIQTVTSGSRTLVCASGELSVPTMPSEGVFYSTARYVSQMYTTLSSVNGVVFSEDTGVYSGSNIYPHLSSFLGWA